jgi:hypothetical protein
MATIFLSRSPGLMQEIHPEPQRFCPYLLGEYATDNKGHGMARSKQHNPADKVEGAFGKEKSPQEHDPLTVSGGTPGSTPAPGKSKSEEPEETED